MYIRINARACSCKNKINTIFIVAADIFTSYGAVSNITGIYYYYLCLLYLIRIIIINEMRFPCYIAIFKMLKFVS